MGKLVGRITLGVLGLVLLVVLYLLVQPGIPVRTATQVAFSNMLAMADAGQIRTIVIAGHDLSGETNDGRAFQTYLPDDPTLPRDLASKHIVTLVRPPQDTDLFLRTALGWLPTLLVTAIWIYWLRRIANAIIALNTTLAAASLKQETP